MKMFKLFSTLALAFGLLFTACKKDETNDLSAAMTTQMVTSSEDQTTSEDLFEDVDAQVDVAIETRGGDGNGGTCPTITVVPADGSYPRTVTIDFGDNCLGVDGRTRSGQIVVNVSDTLAHAGAVRTATFVDYFVDEAHIEGTRTLTNQGADSNGNITFSRTVTGGKVTFPNGDVTTWESSQLLTQVEGASTATFADNVFQVTGDATGVNRRGNDFTIVVTSPLVKRRACRWVSAGVMAMTSNGRTVSIDYGDGTCDRIATMTLPNGNQREILIRRWW